MATFKTQTTTNKGADDMTNHVTFCRLVESEKAPWIVAQAGAVFTGEVFINGIQVRENKNDETPYLIYPGYKKMKDGNPVKDDKGRDEYQRYIQPKANSGTKEAIEELVFGAVQNCFDRGIAPKTRETITTENGTVDVYLTEDEGGLVARVNVKATGTWVLNSLQVCEAKNGEAYIKYPYRLYNEKQYSYYGPGNKNVSQEIADLVFAEVQKLLPTE